MGIGKVLKKVVKTAAPWVLGGIIGGGAYTLYRSHREASKSAKNQLNEQNRAYEQQAAAARSEQSRMNERLSQQQSRVNAGIARSGRSRARGGIFGDSGSPDNQNPLNAKLG